MKDLKLTTILIFFIVLFASTAGWFAYKLFFASPSSEIAQPIDKGLLNVEVTQTGIYAIAPADLPALQNGKLNSWTGQPVALTLQGEPISYAIRDDHLIFFGWGQESIYSDARVYQVHLGSNAAGLSREFKSENGAIQNELPAVNSVNRLIEFQENNRYVSIASTAEWVDAWFWDQIHVSDFFEFEMNLAHVDDGSATLSTHLFGVSHDSKTENDHDLDLLVNGQPAGRFIWDGNKHVVLELDLPSGTLKSGANQIIFDNRTEGNAFIDISEVDWVKLSYKAKPVAENGRLHFKTKMGTIEVSGFSGQPVLISIKNGEPILIEGAESLRRSTKFSLNQPSEIYAAAPNGWLKPRNIQALTPASSLPSSSPQADLLIVTHPDFYQELGPLVEAREAQGLSVALKTTDEIYNRYGHGQPSPQAIQAFIADALTNWPKPAPRYLLLAGGTTYDFRNYLDSARKNRVPSLLIPVEHSGETVSDTRLADIDGDRRADIIVGRWPVSTVEELASIVERTIAYERSHPANSMLFAADGTSSEFPSTSDRLIQLSGSDKYAISKAYGEPWETVADSWNAGNWVVTYVGHGSVDLWGSEEVLSAERVEHLTNPTGTAPPIVLQFTCLTGYFAHPEEQSLSEKMLLDPNGPVLTISASSLTYSSSQEPFAQEILVGLSDPNLLRMGDVVSQARESLDISNPSIEEVYNTFNLLGDPSTLIIRPTVVD